MPLRHLRSQLVGAGRDKPEQVYRLAGFTTLGRVAKPAG
jgi:hypothetical protein